MRLKKSSIFDSRVRKRMERMGGLAWWGTTLPWERKEIERHIRTMEFYAVNKAAIERNINDRNSTHRIDSIKARGAAIAAQNRLRELITRIRSEKRV